MTSSELAIKNGNQLCDMKLKISLGDHGESNSCKVKESYDNPCQMNLNTVNDLMSVLGAL